MLRRRWRPHACLVADEFGMETVFIHPFAGVLSAYGMGLADQTVMREQAVEVPLAPEMPACKIAEWLAEERATALAGQGAEPAASTARRLLHLRYAGTDAALIVVSARIEEVVADFTEAHRGRFGFATPERPITVEAVAVEVIAAGEAVHEADLPPAHGGRPSRWIPWTCGAAAGA